MANTDWRKHTLTNGKEIKLCMSKDEISASYRDAKHKDRQITVLADLNSVTAGSMALYLAELGFDNGYIRNRAKNTAKKLKDTSAPNVTEKMPNVTEKMPNVTKKIPRECACGKAEGREKERQDGGGHQRSTVYQKGGLRKTDHTYPTPQRHTCAYLSF